MSSRCATARELADICRAIVAALEAIAPGGIEPIEAAIAKLKEESEHLDGA